MRYGVFYKRKRRRKVRECPPLYQNQGGLPDENKGDLD